MIAFITPYAAVAHFVAPTASSLPLSWIGWLATAVFVCSYFAKSAARLRLIQAAAALLWMLYGIAIGALPVIVANVIVAVAAGYSGLRRLSGATTDEAPSTSA